jgi:hypothetical protein
MEHQFSYEGVSSKNWKKQPFRGLLFIFSSALE